MLNAHTTASTSPTACMLVAASNRTTARANAAPKAPAFALHPKLTRLDRQALVHHGVAETAAWQAFFAGLPMTWLEVQA